MLLGCAAALLAAAGGEVKLGTYARELGGLADPTAVVLDDDGTTYVLEWALDRVRVFGPDGVERATWGEPGSDWGQLSGPRDIARGPDDNLCIADTGNHRVSVWTEER